MENQIQLYHDMTAFWLDREWRTPRERELEAEAQRLREENKALNTEAKALNERLEPLKVFEGIPCCYCDKPMGNWRRRQVLEVFQNWHHENCR